MRMATPNPFPYVTLFPELKALVRERVPLFERTLLARTCLEEYAEGALLLASDGIQALASLRADERELFISLGLFAQPFWPRFEGNRDLLFWYPHGVDARCSVEFSNLRDDFEGSGEPEFAVYIRWRRHPRRVAFCHDEVGTGMLTSILNQLMMSSPEDDIERLAHGIEQRLSLAPS